MADFNEKIIQALDAHKSDPFGVGRYHFHFAGTSDAGAATLFFKKRGFKIDKSGGLVISHGLGVHIQEDYETRVIPTIYTVGKVIEVLRETSSPRKRLLDCYGFMEWYYELISKEEYTCRKGCSFCCRQKVDVSREEAKLIAERVSKSPEKFIFRELLDWEISDPRWGTSTVRERTCSFLSPDGLCSIYDIRPILCRNLLSTQNPKLCDDEGLGNSGEVAFLNVIAFQVLISAMVNLEKGEPQQLMKAVKDLL